MITKKKDTEGEGKEKDRARKKIITLKKSILQTASILLVFESNVRDIHLQNFTFVEFSIF